jgi:hypothetical protein
LFTVEQRDRVRTALIDMARADERIIAGAEVGSMTQTTGDRWSDLDLTLGVAPAHTVDEVLRDWTANLERDHDAVRLFDLQAGPTVYRVFLFPGGLQVDLSLTPEAAAQTGPQFNLLFGDHVEQYPVAQLDPNDVFGLCVHHALRARIGIERSRLWSAQFYVHELRHETLSLACLQRGLNARYARGFDALPFDVLEQAKPTLPSSLAPAELQRALTAAIEMLINEAAAIDALTRVRPILNELAAG